MLKKETLKSISAKTGYSVSTISRVLAGKAEECRISKKTVDAITQEARKMNYYPDVLAQALRTRKTNTVGLVIPSLDNMFFATMADVVTNIMKQKGITILLGTSMENEETEKEIVSAFVGRNVDGIFIAPSGASPDYLEMLNASRTPIVLMDRYFENSNLQYVSTDNFAGGKIAAEYLISKGYKNFLAIQGLNVSMPNMEMVRGFTSGIAESVRKDIVYSISGNAFSIENGYDITKMVFNSNLPKPDAIFTLSLTIALGAMKAIREFGLKIPQDVAVLSFDDNFIMDFLEPPLTRIQQPIKEICQIACDTMLARITSENSPLSQKILVKPSVVEGKSC